jgi:hypothetical protein
MDYKFSKNITIDVNLGTKQL